MITLLVRTGSLVVGSTVILEPGEEHHLSVRRATAEPTVHLLDGAGARAEGRLLAEGRHVGVRVEWVVSEPPPVATVLAVGAGDHDRFGALAEQAAQLGATRLVPLETERTASVATRLRESHLPRVERRAREAIKQCGAAWAPTVDSPTGVAAFLAGPLAGAKWLADLEGDSIGPLRVTEALTVAIGPEGGFTEEERAAFRQAGFSPVRLGPHLLRFETAAVAALTTAWLARQREWHG
jgi:16S rRNA (uracil1498-N3)-methyltransferase